MFTSINKIRDRHSEYMAAVNTALKQLRTHTLLTAGTTSAENGAVSYPSYNLPDGTSVRTDIFPITTFILPVGNYVEAQHVAEDIMLMETQFLTENRHGLVRPVLMSVSGDYQYDEEDNVVFMKVICPDFGSNKIQALVGDCSRYYFGQDPDSINLRDFPTPSGKSVKVTKFQTTQRVVLDRSTEVCTVFMTPAVLTMLDGTGAYVVGYGDHDTTYVVVPESYMEENYSVSL